MSIEQSARFLFYACLLAVVAATIGGAWWAAYDASRRKKSAVLVFLLVLFLQFPMGLIAWLVFRPPMPGIPTVTAIPKDPDSDLKRRANEGRL